MEEQAQGTPIVVVRRWSGVSHCPAGTSCHVWPFSCRYTQPNHLYVAGGLPETQPVQGQEDIHAGTYGLKPAQGSAPPTEEPATAPHRATAPACALQLAWRCTY